MRSNGASPWLGFILVSCLSAGALAQDTPSTEPLLQKVLKGFYGALDVSFDVTTKGIDGLVAFPYQLNDPANPSSGFSIAGPAKSGPVGRVGWMPALSTNKSGFGYRGDHRIGESSVEFNYQIEAAFAITSSPGLNTSYTQQSAVVKTGLGYGDSFVGFHGAGCLFQRHAAAAV